MLMAVCCSGLRLLTGPGRLSLQESWAEDMLININAGGKPSVQPERDWHKSKKNEH